MSVANVLYKLQEADKAKYDTSLDLPNTTITAGAVLSKGPLRSNAGTGVSAASGIGYATGAGGTVTQITSASTPVTINKACGQITTVALTTAAAGEERFTVNNTVVVATDTVVLSTTYNGGGTPSLSVVNVASGAFDVVITNLHAATAFSNVAMTINFAVIRGVSA